MKVYIIKVTRKQVLKYEVTAKDELDVNEQARNQDWHDIFRDSLDKTDEVSWHVINSREATKKEIKEYESEEK